MARGSRFKTTLFQNMDELRADYDMARESRLRRRRKVPIAGAGADYHTRSGYDLYKCMELGRDVMRNDMIGSSLIDRADDNTIQNGFALDFDTGDRKLDTDLNARWKAWSENSKECDLAQEHAFADMESMAFQSTLVDGDITAVGTDDGCLQWYEGHLLRTPAGSPKNVVHGVELGPGRVRKSFNFCKDEISPLAAASTIPGPKGFTNVATFDENNIRRVFHIVLRTLRRFSQTRGVSACSPMYDLFGMHDDTEFNAILRQQILNALIIFKERTADFEEAGGDSKLGTADPNATHPRDDDPDMLENIGPGTIVKGKKGEKVTGFQSSTPGAQFLPHVRHILTLMGINFGLPLILVLMDASETNLSGWRGAFEQAKMGFRKNQGKLLRRFHEPVLDWKVSQWAAADAALAKAVARAIKKTGCLGRNWHTPTWPYIQPIDDRNADLIAVANYQDSPSAIAAANGLDFAKMGKRCISDRGYMIRLAKEEAKAINSEYPDDDVKVNWTQLYLPPTPATVSAVQPIGEPDMGTQSKPDKAPKPGDHDTPIPIVPEVDRA